MKQIILELLKKRYVQTKRYNVDDLCKYFCFFKNICMDYSHKKEMIVYRANAFWTKDNDDNRKSLISDIENISKWNKSDPYYYRITKSRRNAPCFSYGDVRRFFVNLTYIRFIHIL